MTETTKYPSDVLMTPADMAERGAPMEEGAPVTVVYELDELVECPYPDCAESYALPKSTARHSCPFCERPVCIKMDGRIVRRPTIPRRERERLTDLIEGFPYDLNHLYFTGADKRAINGTIKGSATMVGLFIDKLYWAVDTNIPPNRVVAAALKAVQTALARDKTNEPRKHQVVQRPVNVPGAGESTLPDELE